MYCSFYLRLFLVFGGFAASENMKRHMSRQIQIHAASTTLSSTLYITLTLRVIHLSITPPHTALWALFLIGRHNTRLIIYMHSNLPTFWSLPILINVLFFLFEIIPCIGGFAPSENMKRHMSRQIQIHAASTTLSSTFYTTLTLRVIYFSITPPHTALWALFIEPNQ
jgi:hypothetical protein